MSQAYKMAVRSRMTCAILFLIASVWQCYSADVIFVRSEASSSQGQRDLELAASFYGLDLHNVTVGAQFSNRILSRLVQQKSIVAVVIEAGALPFVNRESLLRDLQRESGKTVPLLIAGITPDTDPRLLKIWSGGVVMACEDWQSSIPLQYVFGHESTLTQQLSGTKIPLGDGHTFYLSLRTLEKARRILNAETESGRSVPLFVTASLHKQDVLLLAKMAPFDLPKPWNVEHLTRAFAEVAPFLMFLKQSAGDRGWHSVGHYANLTIDDPWLREPYGFLSYNRLLQEMERHNFHTTIAFIPWNYDRSQGQIAALIRKHSNRYSICFHGNDHDHKEFTDFETKPLAVQSAALQQAMARMDRFASVTGIPFDKIFVFPHSIGSERILGELKNRNFLATVNASNVPMDREQPASLLFALRPVTLSFAGFPSLFRYSPRIETQSGFLAMNEFLDNPLLFYCHHDFFASGIDAFDATADAVNHLDGNTQWSSLGQIVQHLYLVKKRDKTAYDVLSFSPDLQLENRSAEDLIYYVRKEESAASDALSVTVDQNAAQFTLRNGFVEFRVAVPAYGKRNARIIYRESVSAVPVSASKSSLRVYWLRQASDFRDIVLSKYSVGRALVELYYKYELAPTEVVLCALGTILIGVCLAWRLRLIVHAQQQVRNRTTAPRAESRT